MKAVLFVLDTLRADHLGCYGYFRDTSPTIDKLAKEGVIFPDSHASAVATGPGFTCIITGLASVNNKFYLTPFNIPNAINFDDDILTFPEMIWDGSDVTTAAFDNLMNFRSHMKQFVRGFEYYVNVTRTSNWIHHHVVGGSVNERLLPWIRHHADEDFFLFVHYWDPHGPYNQPDEFGNLFHHEKGNLSDLKVVSAPAGYDYVPGWGKADEIFEGDDIKPTSGPSKHPRSIDTYDGEIKYTDYLIQQVLEELDKQGVLEDTSILITADHGEQLGQHGMYGHGGLHEAVVYVPIILWGRGIPKGKEMGGFVQHVDLAPTILELFGIKEYPEMDGMSLLPVVEEKEKTRDRIFLESNGQRAIMENGIKYIWHKDGSEELYNVEEDPMEVINLAEEQKDKASSMREELFQWVEANLKGKPDPLG